MGECISCPAYNFSTLIPKKLEKGAGGANAPLAADHTSKIDLGGVAGGGHAHCRGSQSAQTVKCDLLLRVIAVKETCNLSQLKTIESMNYEIF